MSNVSQLSAQQTEQQALHHFLNKQYQLLYWRKKIFKTEIDLVLLSPENNLALVEVKSLANLWSLQYRVTPKQRRRLERCRLLCEHTYKTPTELLYAYIYKDEVIVLE